MNIHKSVQYRHHFRKSIRGWLSALMVLLSAWSAHAANYVRTDIPFKAEISGSGNVPTFKITNQSDVQIRQIRVVLGDTAYEFDHSDSGFISNENIGIDTKDFELTGLTDYVGVRVTGFDTLETVTFYIDLDTDGQNDGVNWNDFFRDNNTLIQVFSADPDNPSNQDEESAGLNPAYYDQLVIPAGSATTFYSASRPPTIQFRSISEDNIYVPNTIVEVYRVNDTLETYNSVTDIDIPSYLGDVFEVSAPEMVYWDTNGLFLGDSNGGMNSSNMNIAAERFIADGISVNNMPQTGDATSYRFTVDEQIRRAQVWVRWGHEFALRIKSDVDDTQSALKDESGDPWLPAQTSLALGNPQPAAQLHWIPKGESVTATVDGQVVDYTHPGLDVRFVPTGYRATGDAAFNGPTNYFYDPNIQSNVGQAPPARQQTREFTMNSAATIEYMWQIQYGVRVNIDDVSRSQLPLVYDVDSDDYFFGEGVYWFDPGTHIQALCPVNDEEGGKALAGWLSGDGFYFKASGEIYTPDGSLVSGFADQCDWVTNVTMVVSDGVNSQTNEYHGMDVFVDYAGVKQPGIQRPVRVLWSYGNPAIAVTVPIGEYLLQTAVTNNHGVFSGETFQAPPLITKMISVSGRNTSVDDGSVAIWDAEAAKLYPLVPSLFRTTWSNDVVGQIDVLITAVYPQEAHYPHVANTPPVLLDPDSADSLVFKELKYSENGVEVGADKLFRAATPGWTVLLFGELQQVGRGTPREFLRVRTVETKTWLDTLQESTNAVIGQAITDDELDRAQLGTGYVLFENARYNPLIYEVEKLDGLAAQAVYDMDLLQSTAHGLNVIQPDSLPGPVIPVNLHPGALAEERIVIAWYEDPSLHDNLLWPYATRTYLPRWPDSVEEGLGRIVIASQFGSESLGAGGTNQAVVGSVTTFTTDAQGGIVTNVYPQEYTYNPSRLQQVQVYSQPDPSIAGYNPNEEHALVAASLKNAAVSPRPPAVYALRNNDLNRNKASKPYNEDGQPSDYTSDPFVLVQFFDTADEIFKMRVYEVVAEDVRHDGHTFADSTVWKGKTPTAADLDPEPNVVMEAGEPVIPFYPLGVVWGAVVPPETFGENITSQLTYWEDHKGTSWAVSGGPDAWFTQSPYYPLQTDFWWPEAEAGVLVADESGTKLAAAPQIGSSLSFMPQNIDSLRATPLGSAVTSAVELENLPTEILYKSDWPDVAPVLKAGETLTFSGGEYRADNPTSLRINEDGDLETVETPGLPAVLAFAAAEVVYDSLNPTGNSSKLKTDWTARIAQVLEKRSITLSSATDFPSTLAPASGRTRISGGKYVFTELPASLQKRFRYDPIGLKLEIFGLVNDKDIGEDTLTAAPPAVYVLEANIMTTADREALYALDGSDAWRGAIDKLYALTRNPDQIQASGQVIEGEYLVGLERKILRNAVTGEPLLEPIEPGSDVLIPQRDPNTPAALRSFGPGTALVPNADFLDPTADIPDVSWVTVVENNDSSLGGSPVTPHIIKVDRRERYRGAIKTVLSDNVFDENVVLRHQGDFGANADALYFEWWYRPDDGSLNVPPPDDPLFDSTTSPWKLFPDLTGEQGRARYETMLKGDPNAPEALLADTWWFCRYRHENDSVDGVDWDISQPDGRDRVNFTWAGAGNSDPLGTFTGGIPNYKAQLVMGWIKRVLDAVNPYEARIRDFEGDSPSTVVSMISQFGARFEGPVALNPDKNVIENVGLIELYETILKRGRDLSIDLSRPVSTPAIANALQLAATRISDFYTLLANEAYTDALDPTIGHGSDSAAYGSLAPSVFTFQNQMSSLIEEELALLRGVDDNFARPVYNRLFWNFTKGEGEAAYAVNYDISDVNMDGFVDEDDAMAMYPQGHGDAWGHYLTALGNQYDLLNHRYFNWVSRSEFYNLMDIVIKVDFLDERKFAQMASAKAQAGAEIVDLTYREKYVEDPEAQWQGYTDSDVFRGWGVQGWARRAAQGTYFDWITANALLPSEHPNGELEGIQKVDRKSNDDIAVISANLNAVQRTFDNANNGYNPLGVARDAVPMDIDPQYISFGRTDLSTHFGQIYDRAVKAMANAQATWNHANKIENMLRKIGTTEAAYRNSVYQQDLAYQNKLIQIFGRPYEGTIGSGQLYPAGYDGPDLALHMYINRREINNNTVPGPTVSYADFENGVLDDGDLYDAYTEGGGLFASVDSSWRTKFAPSFVSSGSGTINVQDGSYSVAYTDLEAPKVPLAGLTDMMPITTAGYSFQAPDAWGARGAEGKLQQQLSAILQQEASVANAIASWDALAGGLIRSLRLANSKVKLSADILESKEIFNRLELAIQAVVKGIEVARDINKTLGETVKYTAQTSKEIMPKQLPIAGLAIGPGDALAPARGGIDIVASVTKVTIFSADNVMKIAQLVSEYGLKAAANELALWEAREQAKQSKKELIESIEDQVGDEPVKRIAIFNAIEGLRQKSEQYKILLDEGARLVDERAAFNKRVAAQIQRNRYQDMTFRVAHNHALENYRQAFDLAAKYAYLAAKAYDYETNFDSSDPYSAQPLLQDIVRARSIGLVSSGPQVGAGGLAEPLAKMKANFDVLYSQMGLSNPQWDNGRVSLRTGNFRILAKGEMQPEGDNNFPSPGGNADDLWKQTLSSCVVDDLWDVPEFRQYCRAFSAEYDLDNEADPQPGFVIRFATSIKAGENIFGRPLLGGDYSYDPTLYSTRIRGAGVWFSDYASDDLLQDLAVAPRVYLIPAGADVMSVANSPDPSVVRVWNVVDQSIPAPYPAETSQLDNSSWAPLYDTLSGQYGEIRRYSSFRAYGGLEGEPNYSSRLVGRSVWNTEWVLIIPGITLNYDAEVGIQRFIDQVSDIELVFDTYGYSGN